MCSQEYAYQVEQFAKGFGGMLNWYRVRFTDMNYKHEIEGELMSS